MAKKWMSVHEVAELTGITARTLHYYDEIGLLKPTKVTDAGYCCVLRQKEGAIIVTEWIRCPVCGSKTCARIREDTVLKNYPLYCLKCKQETLIEAKKSQITVITGPDALDAEPMNK